jgi:hypothetical protein
MKSFRVLLLFVSVLVSGGCFAQKVCTANPTTVNPSTNFGSLTWTASGPGATVAECNDMADGLITFTGNVVVDLANNVVLTITNDVNITGNFPITGGPGSKLSVSGAGVDLLVTGNLGDEDNNGVIYEVVNTTSTIKVNGTLFGKNENSFTGAGSISGGTLNVKNGSTCATPCPVAGGFSSCVDGTGPGENFCSDNGVLPITLLSFSAREVENSVSLDWVTVMEEDFEKFVIERSSNGIHFDGIGEVAGAGRNIYDIRTEYNFNDRSPQVGFNYYRLKMVDIDQKFEYSSLQAVKIQSSKKFWVHPNPSTSSINFYTNFDGAEGDRIVLIDQMGKELAEVQGGNKRTIDVLGDVKPGIYVLKYFTQGGQYTSRVILK